MCLWTFSRFMSKPKAQHERASRATEAQRHARATNEPMARRQPTMGMTKIGQAHIQQMPSVHSMHPDIYGYMSTKSPSRQNSTRSQVSKMASASDALRALVKYEDRGVKAGSVTPETPKPSAHDFEGLFVSHGPRRMGNVEEMHEHALKRSGAVRYKPVTTKRFPPSTTLQHQAQSFSHESSDEPSSPNYGKPAGNARLQRTGAIRRPQGMSEPSLREVRHAQAATLAQLEGL
ncbi:hypothetical protein BU23DRAFT_567829 [Bimuria novae-zelandiae CBS 107.79]|uniref:Uncharacterized protein n=1 Tax=Bimuria novae-zelandiae CBS 107.79 TaxID=1447943 RepID=A0A6A5VA07_9PLEO|nr:hypothetical protein BU23DRAFT_567829 [Bimuria novae-zelandiae CBS 107.79]